MDHSETIQRISFIGSGNLATHLAKAFFVNGFRILDVCSKNLAHAEKLATMVDARAMSDIALLNLSAGFLILAVPDTRIQEIAKKLHNYKGVLVHTSGSVPLSGLGNRRNKGVFYPLQTFSKQREVDITNVPICIEGNHGVEKKLVKIAQVISHDVRIISSEERKQIHLAAVFVNNFTNHMFYIAENILGEQQLDYKILLPLIRETAEKIQTIGPEEAQTGPARRNDIVSIEEHLKMLENHRGNFELYRLISEQIIKKYKHEL